MKKPYGFIYITTNLINGKRYIGQKMYRKDWKYYLGSGKAIVRAVKKYGRKSFRRDIVAIAHSMKELDELEIIWITSYDAVKCSDFYNIADGGNGNSLAGKSKEEIEIIKENMSKRFVGKNNPMYGIIGGSNPTARAVICVTTNEIFDTLTEAGNKYKIDISSITKCCKHKHSFTGKLDDGKKLLWLYYDEYEKMTSLEIDVLIKKSQDGINGKNNPRARAVICLSDGKIFSTINETSEYYHISKDSVINVCRKKYPKTKGYSFMYLDEQKEETIC